jgi:hypothetical protein
MLYRLGVHTADDECISLKRIPWDANRLAFGIGMAEFGL